MGIAIFFVLAVIVAAAIAYPLLPGRTTSLPAPTVTDGEIERAVRNLRRARSRDELSCPTCGQTFQPGDRFCVRCGGTLSQPQADPVGAERMGAEGTRPNPACPSCGSTIREGDLFCAKCGHGIVAEEVA
jgi:predicted amidophosphoribosyltransferase